MSDTNKIMVRDEGTPLAVTDVRQQVNLIQGLMRDCMKDGEHFGIIPGCNKPSLLKPGAEKLSLMFRLAPAYDIQQTELPGGHREYRVTCTLTHVPTTRFIGQGVGSCSTLESKYRYRNVSDYEIQDAAIPKDAKEKKTEYRKQGFGMKQVEGVWYWVKYTTTAREENPDIADTWNTVLKIAKKRAHTDAILSATAASDIFTQDMEDTVPAEQVKKPEPMQAKPVAPKVQASEKSDGNTYEFKGKLLKVERADGISKTGKNKGKPYVRYGLMTQTDVFGTFDTAIGDEAETLQDQDVIIIWKQDGQYKTALAISPVFGEAHEPDTQTVN